MEKDTTYENFPYWIALLAIIFSLISYILGALILIGFGIIIVILYLIYCFGTELMIIFMSCKYCYYYGKVCGLGKGIVTPLFTKKGDPKKFIEKEISWLHLIPGFLVVIIPIIGAIILLILNFSWVLLLMLFIIVIIYFGSAAFIRGSFTCKYCKQREIGCPAYKLFSEKKSI